MVLIRIITLLGLNHNVRVMAKHVSTKMNSIADALSRFESARFVKLTKNMNFDANMTEIPQELWPLSKVWLY